MSRPGQFHQPKTAATMRLQLQALEGECADLRQQLFEARETAARATAAARAAWSFTKALARIDRGPQG